MIKYTTLGFKEIEFDTLAQAVGYKDYLIDEIYSLLNDNDFKVSKVTDVDRLQAELRNFKNWAEQQNL